MNLQQGAVQSAGREGQPGDCVDDGDDPDRAIERQVSPEDEKCKQQGTDGEDHFGQGLRQECAEFEQITQPAARAHNQPGKRESKKEDPVHYKGLKKDYVGDVSVLVLACGEARTKQVYLTTRQPSDREKLFQASVANSVQQAMLTAASMNLGTVWVSVREEVEPELRKLFKVPNELRLLWVMPIGHASSWPKAKPRRPISAFTHYEVYDKEKLRKDADIHAWPKN